MHGSLKRSGVMLVGCLTIVVGLLVGCLPSQPAPAATRTKIVTGLFAFPSLSAPVIEIVKAKGLAEKNGLDLETKSYSDASAFYTDLTKKQIADKVTVMCFSEFGRRVEQNSTDGTDHGAAGPMFVCGPKVNGGLHGTHPSLENLSQGDLAFTTDFRTVYAAMLRDWLNADPDAVLKAHFDPLPLIKGAAPPATETPAPAPETAAAAAQPAPSGDMMQMNGGAMNAAPPEKPKQ